MKFNFELDFAKIDCERCGDPERIYAVECGTCGFAPRQEEVNLPVADRTRVVRRARLAARRVDEGPAVQKFYMRVEEELAALESCLLSLMSAAERVSSKSRTSADESDLESCIISISRVKARIYGYAEFRPSLARLKMLRRVAELIDQTAQHYLCALEAATPIDAKLAGRRAQETIDLISSTLLEVAKSIERARATVPHPPLSDFLPTLLRVLRQSHPAHSLAEMDQLGNAKYESICGLSGSAGTGIAFLVSGIFAEAYLSPDRFYDVLVRVAGVLQSSSRPCSEIFRDDALRNDLGVAKKRALDCQAELAILLSYPLDDDATFRQVLKLYGTLYEEVGVPLMALMLLLDGAVGTYASLKGKGATELARRVRSSGVLKPIFEGLDRNLRNAASHGHSYALVEEGIEFDLNSFTGFMTFEAVMNEVFTLTESLSASQLIVDSELGLHGFDDHQLRNFGLFEPDGAAYALELVRDLGYEVSSVRAGADEWVFTLSWIGDSLFKFARVVASLVPSSVRLLTVQVTGDDVSDVYSIPSEGMRSWSCDPDSDAVCEVIAAMLEWEQDGRPYLFGDRLRFASALVSLRELRDHDARSISLMRRLRMNARLAEDGLLFERITQGIRTVRVDSDPSPGLLEDLKVWVDSPNSVF